VVEQCDGGRKERAGTLENSFKQFEFPKVSSQIRRESQIFF
jgi:hypothetical protein